MRGVILPGLAVLMILLLTGSNANAGCIGEITGTDYQCGDTVIESCTFNEDLGCSVKYGLIIGADGITINGAGHSITTSANSDEEGIHNQGCDNVTIKDLSINGFCYGIYFTNSDNCSILNNTIDYQQGSGIWLFSSSYNNIAWNNIYDGISGHGILLSNSANNNTIQNNNVSTVNGIGINIIDSQSNQLYENRICDNVRGDIVVESGIGNTGDNNTCEISMNYSDVHGDPCRYNCPSYVMQSRNKETVTNSEKHACGCVSVIDPSIIFACGDTVTQSCTFNCDLNCLSGHGLIIGADDITINGNHHVLNGSIPGDCTGTGIQRSGIFNQGYDGLIIEDLEIMHFCNGIFLLGDETTRDVVNDNTIDKCEIHHNGNNIDDTATHGIKMYYVYSSTISNNLVHHNTGRGTSCENGGNGIYVYGGEYNILTNNSVYDNTKAGIFTKMKSKKNNITDNKVTGNGQGGIILRCKLSSFSLIENNIVTDNTGPGIYVGGPGNTLRYNTATDNKNGSTYKNDASVANGIRVSREAQNTTLINNNVTGNDEADVYVKKDLPGITGYNNTYQTSSNYLDQSGQNDQMVSGKKVIEKVKYLNNFKSGIELPSVKATPLMATLIVVVTLVFILLGYAKKK